MGLVSCRLGFAFFPFVCSPGATGWLRLEGPVGHRCHRRRTHRVRPSGLAPYPTPTR